MWEYEKTKQDSEKYRKRWFYDQDCDLIVWEDHTGQLARFQFCFGKQGPSEKSIEWRGGNRLIQHDVMNPESAWDMGSPTFSHSAPIKIAKAKDLLLENGGEVPLEMLHDLLVIIQQALEGHAPPGAQG